MILAFSFDTRILHYSPAAALMRIMMRALPRDKGDKRWARCQRNFGRRRQHYCISRPPASYQLLASARQGWHTLLVYDCAILHSPPKPATGLYCFYSRHIFDGRCATAMQASVAHVASAMHARLLILKVLSRDGTITSRACCADTWAARSSPPA